MILLSLAFAGGLEGSVGVTGGLAHSAERDTLLGAEGTLAWRASPWLHVELAAGAGARLPEGAWGMASPRLRAFVGPTDRAVLSVFAGPAALLAPDLQGAASLGLSLEAPGRAWPRISAGYLAGPDPRFSLGFGLVLGRPGPPDPEAAAVDPPVPAPAPAPTGPASTVTERGMVWVPGPACAWLPPDEASSAIARLGLEMERWTLISDRTLRGLQDPPPPDDPSIGKLVVVPAGPDGVAVDGVPVPVQDGVALSRHPAGAVSVRVVGGGRVFETTVGVAPGHAVWISAPPPGPSEISFAAGQDALPPQARDRLRNLAAHAGDWAFHVHGSASPEGTPAFNEELAVRRAEAVRAALIAAGLPAARVVRVATLPADPARSAPDQRVAVIVPVETP